MHVPYVRVSSANRALVRPQVSDEGGEQFQVLPVLDDGQALSLPRNVSFEVGSESAAVSRRFVAILQMAVKSAKRPHGHAPLRASSDRGAGSRPGQVEL